MNSHITCIIVPFLLTLIFGSLAAFLLGAVLDSSVTKVESSIIIVLSPGLSVLDTICKWFCHHSCLHSPGDCIPFFGMKSLWCFPKVNPTAPPKYITPKR